jgi:hypothetical protein
VTFSGQQTDVLEAWVLCRRRHDVGPGEWSKKAAQCRGALRDPGSLKSATEAINKSSREVVRALGRVGDALESAEREPTNRRYEAVV